MKRDIHIQFEELSTENQLTEQEQQLLKAAAEACSRAYAPYSEYHVGAALLLDNGEVVTGSNQENAAYPSGLCAERVAMFYASSRYPGAKIKILAITAHSGNFIIDQPVTPCGSCRQVMSEYENRQNMPLKIILRGEKGRILVLKGTESLLPLAFHAGELKKQ